MKIISKKFPTIILDPNEPIMGIDSSTTGIAWTMIDSSGPYDYGKINLTKISEMRDKIATVGYELPQILKAHGPQALVIEQSIFVSNPMTARKLAYMVGSTIAIVMQWKRINLLEVEPQTWKSFWGHKNISSKFQLEAKQALGNTEGKKLCDHMRKSQTYNVIKHNFPYFETTDDDIADSCGIGLWGWHNLVAPLTLEINHSIAVDLEGLANLGLKF